MKRFVYVFLVVYNVYSQNDSLSIKNYLDNFEIIKNVKGLEIYYDNSIFEDTSKIVVEIYLKRDNNFFNQEIFMYNFKSLLLSGTRNLSNSEIKDKIESIFMEYEISPYKAKFIFSKELKHESFLLIIEIIQNSIFSVRDIDFSEINNEFTSQDFIFFYNSCVYKENNYKRNILPESVLKNTDFYKLYWKDNNLFFIVRGNILKEEINEISKNINIRSSKNSNKSDTKVKISTTIKQQQGTRINFLDKKIDENKIFISSFSDLKPNEREKNIASIYSKIFRSIYNQESSKIYLDFENESRGIVFYSNSNAKIEDIISNTEDIFRELITEGFNDKITEELIKENIVFYNQDPVIFDKEFQKEFFSKFIFPKNLRILIIGKAIEVSPHLEEIGFDINFIDNNYSFLPKPKFILPVEKGKTEMSIIDDYFLFLGGVENIKKIFSIEKKGNIKIDDKTMQIEYKAKLPDNYCIDIKNKEGKLFYRNIFSSTKGYIKYDTVNNIFSVKKIKELRKKNPIFPLMDYSKFRKIKLIEKEAVKGIWCYKIKLVINEEDIQYYYFSQDEKKIIKIENFIRENKEEILKYYTFFNDYKVIDNVMFPFKEEVYNNNDKKLTETNIQQIKINIDFIDKVFD